MAKLIARSPAEGLLPVTHGAVSLSEVVPEAITALMPLRGADFAIPKPNRSAPHGDGMLLWSGIGQAMLLGPVPDPIDGVAMTEQSNSWAMLRLEGEGARDVLARLTPLDLRPSAMAVGHTARSLLGHMNALFHRSGEDAYDILVFRSMTASAVHDLTRAMRGVAARSAL